MSGQVAIGPPPAGAGPAGGPSAAPVGVGVLGATGYAGSELLRLLGEHPAARLVAAGSRSHAGLPVRLACPSLAGADLVMDDAARPASAWADRGVQVVFSALPHGALGERAGSFLGEGLRVVDLSSDHRPRMAGEDGGLEEAQRAAPGPAAEAVYGLTEWCGPELDRARLVANPGCYATAILLAILPAAAAGWPSGAPIVINAVSGVSGAGRAPSLTTHFVERAGVTPYRVGEQHRHLAEIRASLRRLAGDPGPLILNPHLAPMARGIAASIALPLARSVETGEARELYASRYSGCRFVHLLQDDALPETRHVNGSNRCDLAVRTAAGGRMLLVFAALDNLLKGAAGQAIQNWNRMMGWPEPTGLPVSGWGSA